MSLHHEFGDGYVFNDAPFDEPPEVRLHKRRVRQLLEDRLERKRMREDTDELDGEFDWAEYERLS